MEIQSATRTEEILCGDMLVHERFGRCLVVRAWKNEQGVDLITTIAEDGTVACSDSIDDWSYSHYTGCYYPWTSSKALYRDFKLGNFKQFFEL